MELRFRIPWNISLNSLVWSMKKIAQFHGIKCFPQKKKIVCLDFSKGGVKLNCDVYIAVSTPVTVIFKASNPNSRKLRGKVLRCNEQQAGGFNIALILDKS